MKYTVPEPGTRRGPVGYHLVESYCPDLLDLHSKKVICHVTLFTGKGICVRQHRQF